MLQFKTEKIKDEFEVLRSKNTSLYWLLNSLNKFMLMELDKDCVITEIYRSEEEQQALYAEEAAKGNRVPKSYHTFWLAADIRSTRLSPEDVRRVLTFLNCFRRPQYDKKAVAKHHRIAGNAEHIHIVYSGHNNE